jgi:hypothetical protein
MASDQPPMVALLERPFAPPKKNAVFPDGKTAESDLKNLRAEINLRSRSRRPSSFRRRRPSFGCRRCTCSRRHRCTLSRLHCNRSRPSSPRRRRCRSRTSFGCRRCTCSRRHRCTLSRLHCNRSRPSSPRRRRCRSRMPQQDFFSFAATGAAAGLLLIATTGAAAGSPPQVPQQSAVPLAQDSLVQSAALLSAASAPQQL